MQIFGTEVWTTEQYIMPQSAYRKLKAAKSLGQTAYIYAATGYGKTSFAQRFLEKRRHIYLSCRDRRWDESALPARGKGVLGGRPAPA